MDPTIAEVANATRVVLDVLAMRGPPDTRGPFRMTTTAPERMWTAERRERAERWSHAVPLGTTANDVPRLAAKLATMIGGGG